MAASSIWNVSGYSNTPENPYDRFLRSPRDRDGELRLATRERDNEGSIVFAEVMGLSKPDSQARLSAKGNEGLSTKAENLGFRSTKG